MAQTEKLMLGSVFGPAWPSRTHPTTGRYPTSGFFFFLLALQPIVGLYFAALNRALASSRTRFFDHTQRRATVGRTPLDE